MKAIVNETKKFNAAISGAGAHDSRALENIFEKCRHDKKKMTTLVRAFCEAYLVDNQNRPLKLRPLQESIVVTALTHPANGKQRKMAILAPRGSGKSYALSVAATVYMFFKRFRDLIFILAPSEDQASLIFNYVYRHFADNAFLSGLVKNYRFHNKPNITLKGGTVLRRAPVAASNQGQAIRGQHPTFLIVDESPLIDDKLFIDNVEPCIVANKAPFINLGTPKSKENHMWRYLYDDAYADTFTRLVYTWKDAVKAGRAYTPPYTESEMLDKMVEWGEDSIYWRTEYECEFVESVSNIFNPEAIKACRTRGTYFAERGKVYPNCTVAVDIGKSVNSTVISVWAVEKAAKGNIARLISLEEINPRSGGHDIPYQRKRITDTATDFGAERIIIDATGIGGAIEQDIRKSCYDEGIHFIPFVFTGGPKGTKTQAYRDYVSYIQQGIVKIPHPKDLDTNDAKLVNKWIREHCELEYVMDAAQKTERIAAPDGKHDDYCDSSVMGIHACLSMSPASATFASANMSGNTRRNSVNSSIPSVFRTGKRGNTLNKRIPGGL
jgi:DNA-binding XRE family transcriptional regulator